jgi:hypothetical protein
MPFPTHLPGFLKFTVIALPLKSPMTHLGIYCYRVLAPILLDKLKEIYGTFVLDITIFFASVQSKLDHVSFYATTQLEEKKPVLLYTL